VKFLLLIYVGCAVITVTLIVFVVLMFTSVSAQ
jgi:hypothetical protein